VLQDLPDYGVLVSMNGKVELDHLGILSAAVLDPRSKISPLISAGGSSPGSNYYLVEFHPDVDPNAARRLVLNMGLELHDNPDLQRQHLMVYAPNVSTELATLEFLATQDPVAYIFPASAALIAGVPVNVCGGALTVLGPIGQIIATNGPGWDGPGLNAATLSYFFQYVTAQLPASQSESEILRAMAEWAAVIQLTWQPGTSSAGNRTVNVLFATYDHGDGFPFDGPGGVDAHTFYPAPPNPETLAGDVHFDDSESWHIGSNVDVFSVALHELGHALGLGHSDNPNDVMYPYLKINTTLASGDIAAIQTLYAARTGTVPPGPLVLTINPPPATTMSASITLRGTVTSSGTPAVTWITSTGASDGASISGVNWSILSVPLALGLNNITVTAADATGSVSRTVSVTRLIIPPNPSPLVLIVNAPPVTTNSARLCLSGTVTGGSGAPAVTRASNTTEHAGATISGVTWTIVGIPLAIGLNSITVTAADATGSVSQTVNVARLSITGASPLTLVVNAPPVTTTSATISLSGTVTGGSGAPVVTWITSTGASDGATVITSAMGVNWSILSVPLAIGFNSITVTATDATGSVSRTVSLTRTVISPEGGTDTTPPTLTITYPSATSVATTLASLTFKGTVSDPSGVASVTWSTNTGAAGTASGTMQSLTTTQWSAAIPLLVGFNQVIIRATDTVGNMSWRSVVVTRR
jgi:hypothetical protein